MPDPSDATTPTAHLAGRHLWAGQLWMHFGHFMCESLSRLWALDHLDTPPDSILFIPKRPDAGPGTKGFQREFLALLGIDTPMTVLTDPTQVETLIVPGQGFGLGAIDSATPEFRDFIARRFAKEVGPKGGPLLYVSRSALGGLEGGIVLEERIEANLAAQGYEIFHPQRHSIADQIARYRAASHIIGLDGSAFHLLGFVARADQKVALILRRNSSVFRALVHQIESFSGVAPLVINAVRADWIPKGKSRPGRYSFGQLDVEAVGAALRGAGFIGPDAAFPAPGWREVKRALSAIEADKKFTLIRRRQGDAPRKRRKDDAAPKDAAAAVIDVAAR